MTHDLAARRGAALRFRAAIELGDLAWREFAKFPCGSCGVTCELLGEYLRQSGLGDWTFVSGTDNSPSAFRSHAWLEQDGLRIDITGDQFGSSPVVVTYEPLWVGQFEPSSKHVASLDYYGADALAIRKDYRTLKTRADALLQ